MGNEQKRTLVAFLLIIVILLIWSFIARSPAPKSAAEEKKELVDTTKTSPVVKREFLEDTIVVDRSFYRIVLSTSGGGVKSFYLKSYDADIVPEESYLFLTKISDSIVNFNYITDTDSCIFFQEIENKRFTKVYHFDEDFGFTLTINYPDDINQTLSLKSGLRITEKKNQSDDLRHFNVYVQTEKFNNITKEIKESYIYKNDWKWFALRNKYFVLIINNIRPVNYSEFYRLLSFKNDFEVKTAYFGCAMGGNTNRFGLEIISDSSFSISVLLLPIEYSTLAKYRMGYERITSGGIWAPIERIIIFILTLFYSFVQNYGFAIVLFAFLFKIIFFPLSRQMLISQHKMQLLQPELKKVQEKYKNDPQALNREMMHLYKIYKINPFSGCLPLLIQFPVFIALYQVLSTSIQFRRAPFVLWITDLSLKDPYYVLPIAMGALMFIQSLMTTVDPRQKFMVIMMPLVMIFVFLNFPSGLQLYWFTYNILSILENLIIKKKVFPR